MLEPISLDTLYALFRGGWHPARLMRLVADKLGENDNVSYISKHSIPDNQKFLRVVSYLRELYELQMIYIEMGQIEYVSLTSKPADERMAEIASILAAAQSAPASDASASNGKAPQPMQANALPKDIIKVSPTPSLDIIIKKKYRQSPQIKKLYKMLGIGYPAKVIHFVSDTKLARVNDTDNIIELRTRSFLNILGYLSNSVETPPELIARGLVQAPRYPNGQYFDLTQLTNGVLRVHISSQRPQGNVSVAVYYRNHWFYVSDNDIESKKTFAMVEQLFNLQAGGLNSNPGPVLTIPLR